MFKKNALKIKLKWNKSGDPEYPYETDFTNHKLRLRLNDFPEEPLFTLIMDDEQVLDFNDWPKNWEEE